MSGIKDIVKSAKENVYYGVGYSTKDGVSVGAQSINSDDNYGIDQDTSRGSNAVDKALEKVRSRSSKPDNPPKRK